MIVQFSQAGDPRALSVLTDSARKHNCTPQRAIELLGAGGVLTLPSGALLSAARTLDRRVLMLTGDDTQVAPYLEAYDILADGKHVAYARTRNDAEQEILALLHGSDAEFMTIVDMATGRDIHHLQRVRGTRWYDWHTRHAAEEFYTYH